MAPPMKKRPNVSGAKQDRHITSAPSLPVKSTGEANQMDRQLQDTMADLTIQDAKQAVAPAAMLENVISIRPSLRFDDERTHVSASSTKPGSIDGKSTASGTTFALDEKESLRPDDSASVKAAEEEDSYSGTGSGAPSSRVGSESGGRAFRDQFHEISERIGFIPERPSVAGHRGLPGPEKGTVRRVVSPIPCPLQESATLAAPSLLPINGSSFQIEYKDPDEKLFEALDSPKDRLFVLRLEHEVIHFIQNSKYVSPNKQHQINS